MSTSHIGGPKTLVQTKIGEVCTTSSGSQRGQMGSIKVMIHQILISPAFEDRLALLSKGFQSFKTVLSVEDILIGFIF